MKLIPYRQIASAVLALAFPIAVLADLSQSTAIRLSTTLDLDTGAVDTSGGDLMFRGALVPQGSSFTIATSVLQQLPASSTGLFGSMVVSSNAGMTTFTAPWGKPNSFVTRGHLDGNLLR